MKINQEQLTEDLKASLLPVADHDFEIISAEEKPNAKSADGMMTKLVLKVMDSRGKIHKVKTVLGQWKNGGSKTMKSFFESIGADVTDDIPAVDLIGARGTFHSKHGVFNNVPQVEVGYWIPAAPGVEFAPKPAANVADDDSDLPF